MFWSSFAAQSHINDLLDRADLQITELLDDDDVLQKCRELDPRLVNFLCREDNVEFMLKQISDPPNSNEFDTSLYRYPSLICEIMTCDIPALLDLVVGTTVLPPGSEHNKNQTDDTMNGSSMVVDEPANASTIKPPGPQPDLSTSDMSIGSPASGPEAATTAAIATDESATSGDAGTSGPRPRLDCLLRAINCDSKLNPLTASFVSRVLVHLALHRSKTVIPYLRKFPNLLENIVSRLDLTAMADLLVQLAQQERGAQHILFEWFIEDNLVPRLIDCFVPSNSWEVHESAAHCLIQLIVILRNYLVNNAQSGPGTDPTPSDFDSGLPANNPYAMMMNEDKTVCTSAIRLLDILESEETMTALLARLTENDEATTSIVVNCIEVFIAVLDKRRPETGFSVPDGGLGVGMELEMLLGQNICNPSNLLRSTSAGMSSPNSNSSGGDARGGQNGTNKSESIDKIRVARASANLARACRSRLSHLHALLQRAHKQTYNRMNTTVGVLDPPLGRCRLYIVQFLALLAALPIDSGIQEAMVKDGVIKTLMNLFEMYPWNTLLHQAVRDFLVALFTHARVIEKAGHLKVAKNKSTSTTDATASEITDMAPATDTTSETVHKTRGSDPNQKVEMDTSAGSADPAISKSGQIITTVLDEAFGMILRDHQITEWCLRLSPLPKQRSNTDETAGMAAVRLSTTRPKPGYSGHLWQLANIIQDARNGPRGEWVNGLLQDLGSASLKSWEDFVEGDLAVINKEQVSDLTEAKSDKEDVIFQLLAHQNFGSWLSQSSGVFGGLDSGKFSLFLAPLASQQSENKDKPYDQFVLKLSKCSNDEDDQKPEGPDSTDVGDEHQPHDPKPAQSPQFLPSNMWVGALDDRNPTGDKTPHLDSNPTSSQRPLASCFASHGLGTGFTRARVANLSSDEDSDPELDPDLLDRSGNGTGGARQFESAADDDSDDDDDAEDEEEDLKSPVVIKQQRSATGTTASVIKIPRVVGSVNEPPMLSSADGGNLSTMTKPITMTAVSPTMVDVESAATPSNPYNKVPSDGGQSTTSSVNGMSNSNEAQPAGETSSTSAPASTPVPSSPATSLPKPASS